MNSFSLAAKKTKAIEIVAEKHVKIKWTIYFDDAAGDDFRLVTQLFFFCRMNSVCNFPVIAHIAPHKAENHSSLSVLRRTLRHAMNM